VATLKEVLAGQISTARQNAKEFVKQYGTKVIDQVTLEQIYGGMRGISCLICDTSSVPADKGLIIRGRPVAEVANNLPEEVLWLLLTGEMPDKASTEALRADLAKRAAAVPEYVWKVIDAMPADAHPMCLYSTAILALEGESAFRKRYDEGIRKEDFWEPTLEDTLNLVAQTPVLAAGIYRKKFNKGPRIAPDAKLDLGANFVHMLGLGDKGGEFTKLMRLYLVLHSDHENGNVSAMATATVNSALSDLYYSLSAGMNGLAGPLHGLANQECLNWVLGLMKKLGGTPTKAQIEQYADETLGAGKVIPGYGHGVLRVTDPRFECFYEFGKANCPEDPVFKTVKTVFEVIPGKLQTIQKIKNPWPNVDAASGSLLYHFGLTETLFYTVLFGVSRTMGVCAQSLWSRAMMQPIIRPKSVTTAFLESTAKTAQSGRQPSA